MSCVTCHVSHVTCHVSHVMCHMSQFFSFFFTKWWSLSVEGLLSTGPTPSSLCSSSGPNEPSCNYTVLLQLGSGPLCYTSVYTRARHFLSSLVKIFNSPNVVRFDTMKLFTELQPHPASQQPPGRWRAAGWQSTRRLCTRTWPSRPRAPAPFRCRRALRTRLRNGSMRVRKWFIYETGESSLDPSK